MAVPDAPAVEVAHVLPGRVRLRVPALKHQPPLAQRLEAVAGVHPGVRRVRANPAGGSVVVECEPALSVELATNGIVHDWLARAAREGLPVPAAPAPQPPPRLVSAGFTLAGLALTFAGGGVPHTLALVATALGAWPIVQRAVQALVVERRPSEDHLEAAALAVLLFSGDVRGAALTRVLVALGDQIRDRTAHRSRRLAAAPASREERWAWLVVDGQELRTPLEALRVDDRVAVHAGEPIPVDGSVTEGAGRVAQRALTGEARPHVKAPGDSVYAGTLVIDGMLHVRARAVGRETRIAVAAAALQQAPVYDSRVADYTGHVSERLVLPTLALAGLSYAASGDRTRAAAVLNVDFGTGMLLSAPASVLATMTRAARDGILLKSGRALERLADADAIVLDKTGTLTRGRPEVGHVVSLLADLSADDVLVLAAAAELPLRHLLARAIVRHARRQDLVLPEAEGVEQVARAGVTARVGGRVIRVGSYRFLNELGVVTEHARPRATQLAQEGHSIIFVSVDAELAGLIAYHDPPRPESAAVVAWLRMHGVRTIHLVTGDAPAAAHAVARALGIAAVHASTLPDQRAAVVRDLQRQGHVVAAMGDGADDAPMLATADVSISHRFGAEAVRETADVLLLDPDLTGLLHAIELARSGMGLIRQNMVLVAVPNAVALALAVAGRLNPVAARLLSDGSTLLAAGNSLRPLFSPGRRGR